MTIVLYEIKTGKPQTFVHAVDAKECIASGVYTQEDPKKKPEPKPKPVVEKKPEPKPDPEPVVEKKPELIFGKKEETPKKKLVSRKIIK